jgi:D-sedoheptulose 7-phosphate isomerase
MENTGLSGVETVISRIQESIEVLNHAQSQAELINESAEMIITSFKSGNKLLICGNGGSAADAQHIAAEFIAKFYRIERPALPAIALSTNTSILTAIGNDFGYDMTFIRQVQALGKEGDVFLAISTSGNSINAVEAAKMAKEKGMKVISLTGEKGGSLAEEADIAIKVASNNTPIIQNGHIAICHIICEIVENAF